MGTRQRSIVQDHGQQHTQAVRARLMDRRSPAGVNKILAALRGVPKEAWRLGQMDAERPTTGRSISPVSEVNGCRVDGRSRPTTSIPKSPSNIAYRPLRADLLPDFFL